MKEKVHFRSTIGIVLSSAPGYSETFFRNKIKGLQENGYEVIVFVDDFTSNTSDFPCKLVSATGFSGSIVKKIITSFLVFIKVIFEHPNRSYKLFKLDEKDGLPFKKRVKNLLLNQYLLAQKLDWLHYGFGMLAKNRENVAQAIGAKMAVSFRGFDLYLSPLKHQNCYDLLFSKKLSYHVLSNKMKSKLIESNVQKSNIHVITPAIDVNLFHDESIKSKSQVVNIICISRLHWIKGLEYTLEAMCLLKKEGVNFKFTIIGDGEERERLMFATHQFGLSDCVEFTGKLPQIEVIEYLRQADIYVQYSIQEGFGNAVLEAQAMGLFCVVSDADGLRENVLHQITGYVVPKRQPILLAQSIKDVIVLNSTKKDQIIQYAIERVKKDFNLVRQKALFLDFYNN